MVRPFALLFLTALAALAQPTMPVSPVQGNPADLRIQTQPAGYTVHYNSFEVRIGTDCSFVLVGSLVLMDNGQNGLIGNPGTIGSICQIDTGASQLLSDGYIFRIQRIGALGTYDVVAHYTEYGGQYSVTTLGQWAAGPPVAGPTLTTPIPGSTLPLSASAFNWTAGTGGVSTYGFRVGTNPGSADLYNQTSTTGLSAYVSGLPSNGAPIYVSLLWLHPVTGVWQTKSYTYSASLAITPPQITSPLPGTVITTPSVTVTWNDSPAAETNWTQIGTTAGGGELSQYQTQADTTKIVNVPVTSEPFVFVNLSAQANNSTAGWVSSSVVYATPAAAGAPVPRASKLQAPVTGALLSGNTYFQWDWGNGALDYRLEVGTAPGTANIYNGAASLNSAVYVMIPAHGGLVYATVYTRFASGTLAETAVYSTQSLGQTVPYQSVPAQVIATGQPAGKEQTATLQWNSGVGVDCYWVSLGTVPNTANLFDQRGECTNQRAATIPTLPTTGATLQPTLYSRINNVWYPAAPVTLPTRSEPMMNYDAFKTCVSAAGTGSICELRTGSYLIGPGANTGIAIERSNIIVTGSAVRGGTRLIRSNPVRAHNGSTPGAGCEPMIRLAGVSNVTIRDLIVDGGGLAFPSHCTNSPFTTPPNLGDQPTAEDIVIGSTNSLATSGITIDNVQFHHSIGRALVIYNSYGGVHMGQPISQITIRNSEFLEAQLTGILVGTNGAYDQWQPGGPFYQAPLRPEATGVGRGCNADLASRLGGVHHQATAEQAAITARVPRGLVVENSRFLQHWTGTIALNNAYDTKIGPGNIFIDNYTERSWDGGGGTIFEDVCVIKSDWFNNEFDNSGLPRTVVTGAFEANGRYSTIRNNIIRNQPENALDLKGTVGYVVHNNQISDASRNDNGPADADFPAVRIGNTLDERTTFNLHFYGNMIANSTPGAAGNAAYAVEIGFCANGADTPTPCGSVNPLDALRLALPYSTSSNVFVNFHRRPKPMCAKPDLAAQAKSPPINGQPPLSLLVDPAMIPLVEVCTGGTP